MPDWVTTGAAFIFVLGIMMIVHEWGHFIAARIFGIRVEIFSFFGMGPRVWGFKRGDTEYRLSLLPIGAYVKMAGEDFGGEHTGQPDEFPSKPRWQRAIVLLAGPTMNLLAAVLLVTAVFINGMPQPVYLDQPAEVAGVIKDSIAEKAGIQSGDRIAVLNGIHDPKWEQVFFESLAAAGSDLSVVLDRNGERVPLTVPTAQVKRETDALTLLGYPKEPVIVGLVQPGMPADRSGLRPGDHILALDARPVWSPLQFRARLQEVGDKPAELLIQRGERELRLQVRPVHGDPGDGGGPRYQLGFAFRFATVYKQSAPLEALTGAIGHNARLGAQIVWIVGQLVQGKASLKQLQGPVGIMRESGQAARRGILELALFMAAISLNLGILNLLPIPILDGGHIVLLLIEGAFRRELSMVFKERVLQFGAAFLILLTVFVLYNDVLRSLPAGK